MIIIDTHIWIWWVHGDDRLSDNQLESLWINERDTIGVSAISCWEISKLVEYNRIELPGSLQDWFEQALMYPGVNLVELTPEIAIESTRLPGILHRDPADQIIIASAKIKNCQLLTSDRKILDYPHVDTIP